MNDLAKTVDRIARTVMAVAGPVMSLALIVLIAGTISAQLGFALRGLRVLNPTELAYLCGAVWLWRRAAP